MAVPMADKLADSKAVTTVDLRAAHLVQLWVGSKAEPKDAKMAVQLAELMVALSVGQMAAMKADKLAEHLAAKLAAQRAEQTE